MLVRIRPVVATHVAVHLSVVLLQELSFLDTGGFVFRGAHRSDNRALSTLEHSRPSYVTPITS